VTTSSAATSGLRAGADPFAQNARQRREQRTIEGADAPRVCLASARATPASATVLATATAVR
jgi:hypothetical protein